MTAAVALVAVVAAVYVGWFALRALGRAWIVHRDRKLSLREKIARDNRRNLSDPRLYLR